MKKAGALVLFIFLSLMLPISIFAGGGLEEQSPQSAAVENSEKLTVLHFMGEQTKRNGLKALCDAVTAKHPEITFEIEGIAYTQYPGILKTRIAADDAPDLFTGWPAQYVELIEAGQVMDLTSHGYTGKIVDNLRNECTINGKVYGMPLDIQMYGVFYNKELFAKYNVAIPKTFDELLNVCDTFMSNGIYPFIRALKSGNMPWVEYSTFAFPILALDPTTKNVLFKSVVDKKAKFMDYPSFVKTIEIYNKLLKYNDPGDFGLDEAQAIVSLASGKRPMYLNGGWITGDLYASNPDGKFGFFPTPWSNDVSENKAVSGLDDVFMAYANSDNLKGIQYFFDMLTSEEGANIWMESTKLMSATKGAKVPEDNEIQQDINVVLSEGNHIPRASIIDLSGEYKQKMRANIQLFAVTPDKERNVQEFVKHMDNEFALIR